MTTVVPFTHAPGPAGKVGMDGTTAEIIIFPGVRIERHDDLVDLRARVLDTAGGADGNGHAFGGPAG